MFQFDRKEVKRRLSESLAEVKKMPVAQHLLLTPLEYMLEFLVWLLKDKS